MVPLMMNVLIVAGMLWRVKYIWWFYVSICFSLIGRHNETTIDTANNPIEATIREILRRTMTFMVDLLIYTFIWPWPRHFFAGQTIGSPSAWRLKVGFRDKEVIVRRSGKWDRALGNVLDEENAGTQILQDAIHRAVDPIYMSEKTGYLMLNRDWDLDWKTIIQATKLVDEEQMILEDFKTKIFVFHPEYNWLTIETAAAGGSVKEEEGRRKIVSFKEELMALGKENLFFRWIELVQYESSKGDFGPDQQQRTMQKARELASQFLIFPTTKILYLFQRVLSCCCLAVPCTKKFEILSALKKLSNF